MAITITAYDTDKNGTGVDVLGYLSKFDTTFVPGGRGAFSGADGMSGKQYALYDAKATGLVFDAGKTNWAYDVSTHQVSGSLSALRFGTSTKLDAATHTFKQTTDLKISSLGLESATDANALRSSLSAADTKGLLDLLKTNSINFIGSTGKDVFKSFDRSDILNGGAGDDMLFGQGGNDTVKGGTGNDKLYGGAGNDLLSGEAGNDAINGGAGADRFDGGAGSDTVSYAGATRGVVGNLAKASANTNDAKGDTYVSIENLTGSSYADTLTGNSGANRISGGKGNDTLTGGGGADNFVFAKGYGKDTITDFRNNIDDIDLRSYDFSSVGSVLKKAVQVGSDVHIKLSSTDVIVLDEFRLKDLDAADFLL